MVAFDRNPQDFKYLRLLSRQFPTEQSAFTEIINLSAILNLPKGTEHFMSDVHGEYEAFMHILNNCSGVIREKVDYVFGYDPSAGGVTAGLARVGAAGRARVPA